MSYQQPQVIVPAKDILIAYLIWFFLGAFGVHKFYLRQPVQGVVYLGLWVLAGLVWLITLGLFGWVVSIPVFILLVIDAFLIPGRVRRLNSRF